jgi:uncharacterized protein (DUF1684 family)
MSHPTYRQQIEHQRAENDEWLKHAPDSPILRADRATFTGLPYFPVDEAWRITGLRLEPYDGTAPSSFGMGDTQGEERPAERVGQFHFAAGGATNRLVAYQFYDDDGELDPHLFVPFMDATTGTETYGAGRYLDLEPAADGTWTLDFNVAYHPTCVHDPRYSCPITPAENRLAIRVEAGESLPGGGAH